MPPRQSSAREPSRDANAGDDNGEPRQQKPADQEASKPAPDKADPKSKQPNLLRRHPYWTGAAALAVAALAALGFFGWLIYLHPYETTDDAFIDARYFTVAPKVAGYVTAVDVTDNQHVEAGATLFRIDPRDYEVAVRQAEARLDSAEAAVANAEAQIAVQRSQVDAARDQVTQAEATLKFAEDDAARYRDLARTGAGSVQRQQQTESNLRQQQAGLAQAKANVAVAEKRIGQLEAQRGRRPPTGTMRARSSTRRASTSATPTSRLPRPAAWCA